MAKHKYDYTIGIDPSGAFYEGKGTTGWCVLDNKKNTVVEIGALKAKDYNTPMEYWESHLLLIKSILKKHHTHTVAVSIEDYILYKNYAMAQINSTMETVQLIGIIKYFCHINGIALFIRPAVAVKNRWSDDILVHKKILVQLNKHYVLPNKPERILSEHERDSIRHAVHFNMFENN